VHRLAWKAIATTHGTSGYLLDLANFEIGILQANLVRNPWRTILKPAYRPQLVIALTATLFQQ